MEPYENQLIGAFIFELGRRAPKDTTMAVNLFQQTPLDCAFGDLVAGSKQCLVMEFKRNAEKFKSERDKWPESSLRELSRSVKRTQQSIQGHVVIYGKTVDQRVDMRWCGYWDVVNQSPQFDRGSANYVIKRLTHPSFFEPIQPDAPPGLGLGPEEMGDYLTWLQKAKRKSSQTGSAGGRETWLGVASTDSGVVYIAADSLEHLLKIEAEQAIEIALGGQRQTRARGYGPER